MSAGINLRAREHRYALRRVKVWWRGSHHEQHSGGQDHQPGLYRSRWLGWLLTFGVVFGDRYGTSNAKFISYYISYFRFCIALISSEFAQCRTLHFFLDTKLSQALHPFVLPLPLVPGPSNILAEVFPASTSRLCSSHICLCFAIRTRGQFDSWVARYMMVVFLLRWFQEAFHPEAVGFGRKEDMASCPSLPDPPLPDGCPPVWNWRIGIEELDPNYQQIS